MISLISLLLTSTAAFSALAANRVENTNNNNNLSKRQISASEQGTGADGFFYNFWTDENGNVTFTNGDNGSYDVVWTSGSGSWFGGKGWAPGSSSPITYSSTYHPTGTSHLSIYGWTHTNHTLIEYYIVQNYHTSTPGSTNGDLKGHLLSDGASYDIYEVTRFNPGLGGWTMIRQYWSVVVREEGEEKKKRSDGGTVTVTVTVQNHFDAWAGVGLELGGTHEWQIVAVEGYFSAGEAGVVVDVER
ncbi:hypothetical protein FQN50_002357 [Emmonsiellopsis sp. PD_5]|nr:hypothetical protein FQN50_002357 [Emmonsiellopsis sp. PD_5]